MNGDDTNWVGYGRWSLGSYGPDHLYGPYDPVIARYTIKLIYDPTNGVSSIGDLVHCQKFGEMTTNKPE